MSYIFFYMNDGKGRWKSVKWIVIIEVVKYIQQVLVIPYLFCYICSKNYVFMRYTNIFNDMQPEGNGNRKFNQDLQLRINFYRQITPN